MPRKSTKVPRVCEQCGKDFLAHPCVVRRPNGARFCSQSCSSKWRAQHHLVGRHRTEAWVDNAGYVRLPSDGKAYRAEHRIVMEGILGRTLTRDEIVHHIDGDRTNNAPENLQVMSQAEHRHIHARQLRERIGWSFKHERCIECGTTEIVHKARGYCNRCYTRLYYHSRIAKH